MLAAELRAQEERLLELEAARKKILAQIRHDVDAAAAMVFRPIATPPGYWMERVAGAIFFFAPKTVERVFSEIVADYRHEMIASEAKGASKAELRKLKIQHWGGFIIAVFDELLMGVLGRIVKVFKGG